MKGNGLFTITMQSSFFFYDHETHTCHGESDGQVRSSRDKLLHFYGIRVPFMKGDTVVC